MIGRSAKVAENATLRKQRDLDALTARDRELDMLFERLYEDNVAGKIDDARFAKMSKRYEQEQGENAKKIKSLRLGKASLTDCYCYFNDHELFVRGMNISEYHWGSYNNHMPKRDRKLLLQRRELAKLERALQDKGLTIVGLKLFINDKGLAKLQIGLGRGRKSYDKREYIKEKDARRELERVFRK